MKHCKTLQDASVLLSDFGCVPVLRGALIEIDFPDPEPAQEPDPKLALLGSACAENRAMGLKAAIRHVATAPEFRRKTTVAQQLDNLRFNGVPGFLGMRKRAEEPFYMVFSSKEFAETAFFDLVI